MPKAVSIKKLEPKAKHDVPKNVEFRTKQPIENVMFAKNMTIRSKVDATTLSMATTSKFDIYDYGDRVVLEPLNARGSRCVLFPYAIAYIALEKDA